ncbi:hypothetical protein SERLADRAFT_459773 [Serpula lacrymans var. lacrymans S7.9]|uniref:Uncharacterized protein n=1 Tax=Serpula lacrymans var. lacrymans (strain S7.9) TaxID=578457 RepID=F8NL80_SERL9|nr:uncharacterized protein SERLADRAFT_459773 [Serpula lacrymans var. lacrymans S7.9]EGO28896.1 hypothetical protein SERLADRAFT_459773 [Serpula lacrymans var. lacrymans S7.9]
MADMQPLQDEDEDKVQGALATGQTQKRAAEAGTVIRDEVREKNGLSESGKEEGGMEEKQKQKDEGMQEEPLPSRVPIEASRDPLKPSEPPEQLSDRPSQPPQVQPPHIRAQPPQSLLKEIPPRVPGSQGYLKKAEPAAAIAFSSTGAGGLSLEGRSRELQGRGEQTKEEKPIKADHKDETVPNQGKLTAREGVTHDNGKTVNKTFTGVGAGGALFGAAALTEEEKQRKISHIQSEDADREKLGEYQRDRERMGREASGQEGILKASGMEEKVRDKEVGGETGVKKVKKAREEDKQESKENKESKAGFDLGAALGNGAVGGKDFAAQGSAIPGNGVAHDDMPKKEPGDESGKAHEHGQGRFLPGYQTNYHPSDLHPASGDETKGADNDTALKSPGEGSHFAGDSEDGDIASHEGMRETSIDHGKGDSQEVASADKGGKRVSFLKKMKGEAKIIAGKVSGKEGKVEAGKRVLHGEV